MSDWCMGCMTNIGVSDICPHCGYSDRENNIIFGLPLRSVLKKQYVIGKVLGYGGFGITYLAWDLQLNVKLAIKEYLPRIYANRIPGQTSVNLHSKDIEQIYTEGKVKFLEEARILAGLNQCSTIVSVKDFFEENDTAYIVMYYIDGITLKEYLKKQGGRLPADEALEIMKPVIQSLEIVHKKGILHRDISPDNIYITNTGEVKLLDFGASKEYITEASMSVVLKHGYGPPEQYFRDGFQGPWTDIYAVSATLYQLITGEIPPESVSRYRNDKLKRLDFFQIDLPSYIEESIMKGLALEIEDRHATINDFYHVLYNQSMDKPSDLPLTKTKISKKRIAMLIVTIITACIMVAYSMTTFQEPTKINTLQKETNDSETGIQKVSNQDVERITVVFEDVYLEQVLREALNKPEGVITSVDCSGILELNAINKEIRSLKGLEYCTNLVKLELSQNELYDLTPITQLTQLEEIALANNDIYDLSFLEGLKKLTVVDINNNRIKNIDSLSGLTSLHTIFLDNNFVKDLSPLKPLTDLYKLHVSNNEINDISGLEGHTNLHKLKLSNNAIKDISSLSGLSALDELELFNNPIENFEPIQSIYPNLILRDFNALFDKRISSSDYIVFPDPGLERLIREIIQKPDGRIFYRDVKDIVKIDSDESTSYNISSIEGLQYFTNLEILKLARNNISNVHLIQNLTKLKAINFADNQISDISPLENLLEMEDLDLCNNKIKNLSPLSNMTKLKILIMMGNSVEDITPLKKMTTLQELRLEYNNIGDIAVVKNFINLKELNISKNPIRDYTVLDEMKINSIIK